MRVISILAPIAAVSLAAVGFAASNGKAEAPPRAKISTAGAVAVANIPAPSSAIQSPPQPAAAAATTSASAAAATASTVAIAEPSKPAKPMPAPPALIAKIDLSNQRLTVHYDGVQQHSWAISSGRAGYPTPRGTYRPQWTAKMWYSRKYDNAPMPHSVFFVGGVAIHATYATGMLGRPASHGCVRLAPANAAKFYRLVHTYGLKRTSIRVFGTPPPSRVATRKSRPSTRPTSVKRSYASSNGFGWNQPTTTRPSAPSAAHKLRRGANGLVYLPKGSPMRGRNSFVLNGVRYVRVR